MARYDWDYFKHRYVTGDDAVTLNYLSTQPNAPSLHRLKIKSSEDAWAEQRKQFRNQAATVALNSATGQAATQQIQKLVDAAEMITRHLQISKGLQGMAWKALQDRKITESDLTARDVLAWLNTGVQMERLTLDLDTARIKVDTKIDFASLSDEQLERIANGEDPEKVTAA